MLRKIDTKKKLLLFPAMFMLIVILSGIVYSHWTNQSNIRNEIALEADEFVQQILKGRISVYQFLRSPSDKAAQKVREDFSLLNQKVLTFKSRLSLEKNRILSDEIILNSKKYVEFFDAFSNQRVKDFENGIKDESSEIKNNISQMVQTGSVLESKVHEIYESAVALRIESNESLNDIVLKLENTGMFSLKEGKKLLKKLKSEQYINDSFLTFKGEAIAKNVEQEFKI